MMDTTTDTTTAHPTAAKKLPPGRRKAVSVSPEQLVKVELLETGRTLPLVVRPALKGVDLLAWATDNRALVEARLLEHGAILFRDFGVSSATEFERLIGAMSGETLEYRERSSPRRRVRGNIYTSTDYPAGQMIFPHNESSYALNWPLKVYFFCETPAARGGETPLADVRQVFGRITPEVRERFIAKKWMHVRNFGTGFGLSWQTVFQTDDRSEVEQHCQNAGIRYEWRDGNHLRIRQVRPAVAQHPRTGEWLWFNHATFFHASTLEPGVREKLQAEFRGEDLPNNTYYGDGSEIEPHVMDEMRAAYLQELVEFAWEKGDVLMLDNMLTAHARRPFAGERKILVGMSEPFRGRE
jgi:alpha-ketoglutarate-dependent taurine dioxygenase